MKRFLCLWAILFGGCRAPMPSFNVMAPFGATRVPAPSTGSFGTPDPYYPNGQPASNAPRVGMDGKDGTTSLADSTGPSGSSTTNSKSETTTWKEPRLLGSRRDQRSNSEDVGSGIRPASHAAASIQVTAQEPGSNIRIPHPSSENSDKRTRPIEGTPGPLPKSKDAVEITSLPAAAPRVQFPNRLRSEGTSDSTVGSKTSSTTRSSNGWKPKAETLETEATIRR